MPRLNTDDMASHQIGGSNFGFSAQRVEKLLASEYTLVLIICDVSGSVSRYADELVASIQSVVRACRQSPRADNLLLRLVLFNHGVEEVHGYKLLSECHEDQYDGCVQPHGTTALYDATYNGVGSLNEYGAKLTADDYDCNAIVFVITDGMEYPQGNSTATPKMIREQMDAAVSGENVESLVSILVGVMPEDTPGNAGPRQHLSDGLGRFKDQAGFTQYVEMNDASDKGFARLAEFTSKSISSQSQALGTGGPSQSISF